jgi:hypothetical protein
MTAKGPSPRERSQPKAPIALERYAELSAEIDAGVPEKEILERESITDETWAAAKAFWLKRMADEASRKRFESTTRYQAIFKAKRAVFDAKLRRERDRASRAKVEPPASGALDAADRELRAPLVSNLAPLSLPEAPPSTVPVPARGSAATPAPSFLNAPTPAKPMPAAPPAYAGPPAYVPPQPVASANSTGPVGPIPRQVMPFQGGAAAAPPARVAPPAASPAPVSVAPATAPGPATVPEPPPRKVWGTMVADASDLAEAMPFKQNPSASGRSASPMPQPAAPPAPPPPAPPPPAPGKSGLGSTMNSEYEQPHQQAMPFRHGAAAAAPPPAPPSPLPSVPKKQNLGATMMADFSAFEDKPLPFATAGKKPDDDDDDDSPRTAAIDPEAARAAILAATPFREKAPTGSPAGSPPPQRRDSSPSTMAIDITKFPGAPPGAMPPGAVAPAPPPAPSAPNGPKRFSINVFASLTAEMAERPGEADAVRRKYGVTEAEHKEESERWTADFAMNDDLRKRYLGIVQRYRGYLKGGAK